jgi:hypothetical protein
MAKIRYRSSLVQARQLVSWLPCFTFIAYNSSLLAFFPVYIGSGAVLAKAGSQVRDAQKQ